MPRPMKGSRGTFPVTSFVMVMSCGENEKANVISRIPNAIRINGNLDFFGGVVGIIS